MARDSQAALVALNRFGFGARGGASGDFVNAASDPRGFVKAELGRPNGVLLELPGLQSTPALAQAVFAYQLEIKQAREAAAKAGAPAPLRRRTGNAGSRGGRRHRPQAMEKAEPAKGRRTMRRCPRRGDAARRRRNRAPQPLNIIQKTYRAEALARIQRAMIADCGFVERLVVFWSNHFCISAEQGRTGADVGRCVRARGDPSACVRPLRRHAEGGRAASGDVALSRQPAIDRSRFARRRRTASGAERKSRPRDHGTAYARRRRRLHAGRRNFAGAHHHRLDLAGRQGQVGAPGSFFFNANAHEPGAQRLLGKSLRRDGVEQGEAALADIARHPATAKFIASKFARAFRGRRSAARSGRAAAGTSFADRRRPQGPGDGAGGFRRGVAGAADQDAQPL